MAVSTSASIDFEHQGFAVINAIYSEAEVKAMLAVIDNTPVNKDTFRKTRELFAIRQFINEVPAIRPLIFNQQLTALITQLFGAEYFVSKSIYFDKPPHSNWFVAYHQDLTISVNKKADVEGFGPWTIKQNQFAVQPTLSILQNSFTIRIHLDNTDEYNGALKVIPGSHHKGIYRAENIDWSTQAEAVCRVNSGGVMLMRPLLLHASNRSVNHQSRRVIHLEFSNGKLPGGLTWAEKYQYQHEHN